MSIDQYREGYEQGKQDNLAGKVIASILNQLRDGAVNTVKVIALLVVVPRVIGVDDN